MVVSVQHSVALPDAESGDFQPWLESLSAHYSSQEIEAIRAACELAAPLYDGRTELTGTPLIQHALGAAAILAGLNMDADTHKATILHGVPSYLPDWREKVESRFGKAVADLVDGISQMERIQEFSELESLHEASGKRDPAQQIESLRKMLLAMAEDIRVVLIKLAERTQTLRNLNGASDELQLQIARETEGIYAPLANRLGVWQIKWEMEDLALRYQEPRLYKDIAKRLDERRVDREQYIADVVAQLQGELARAGIKGEVNGRPKHIFSIINKMRRKNLEFNQLYDVRGVRSEEETFSVQQDSCELLRDAASEAHMDELESALEPVRERVLIRTPSPPMSVSSYRLPDAWSRLLSQVNGQSTLASIVARETAKRGAELEDVYRALYLGLSCELLRAA